MTMVTRESNQSRIIELRDEQRLKVKSRPTNYIWLSHNDRWG